MDSDVMRLKCELDNSNAKVHNLTLQVQALQKELIDLKALQSTISDPLENKTESNSIYHKKEING